MDEYFAKNLGDDLFVNILTKRYPNHKFYAIAENEKGYMSDEVTMMVVKGELLEINDIHDTDTIVEGRGEADNRISILKDGIEIGSTVIGSDGTFKAEIKPQENGTQLDIISKLKDGQISSKITVNVTSEKVVDKTSG